MSTEFLMPKLGLTMEEGTIVEWLVPDGTEITRGTPVLVIATDKVETEVEAPDPGRLHQLAEPGATFACGETIALLLAEGEEPPTRPAAGAAADAAPAPAAPAGAPAAPPAAAPARPAAAAATRAADGRILASPYARKLAAEAGIPIEAIRGTGPGGRIIAADVDEAIAAGLTAPAPAPTGIIPATIAARNLADLLGIDLATVSPDPVERRVTRQGVALHVRALLAQLPPAAPASAAPAPAAAAAPAPAATRLAPASQTPTRIVPMRGMRGTIASRMHESLQTMAQLTLHMDADMDAVVADRRERVRQGAAPGYTDYVMAAVARALRDHPMVNAQVVDEGIALLPEIHVGIAVAVEDGLMVPVVRHTDQLDLAQLSETTSDLARRAREKRLELHELEGGTFSVSALGMFGVDGFTPVINPPNVAIMGVGRIRDDLALVDGEVTVIKRATLSLTWDHRVLDGAPAAEFCRSVVQQLADPAGLDAC